MIDVLNIIFNCLPEEKIHYIVIAKFVKLDINPNALEAVCQGDLYSILNANQYDIQSILYHALMYKKINIVNYMIHKHQLVILNSNMTKEYRDRQNKLLYKNDILTAIGYCGDECLIRKICCKGFLYTTVYIKRGILNDNNYQLLKNLSNLYYFT